MSGHDFSSILLLNQRYLLSGLSHAKEYIWKYSPVLLCELIGSAENIQRSPLPPSYHKRSSVL